MNGWRSVAHVREDCKYLLPILGFKDAFQKVYTVETLDWFRLPFML